MGCISSKVIARSISFHEDRKERSQRTSNSIPLFEDLIISSSGTDQYLALLRAANSVSHKLHSRSFNSNTPSKLAVEPASSETFEKFELSDRPDQEGVKQIESDKKNRSKSWHQFPDHSEDKHDLSSKGDIGSRSFHTVEEYDALVNKIMLTKSFRDHQSEFHDEEVDDSGTNMDFIKVSEILSDKTHPIEDKNSDEKNRNSSLEEREIVKEINIMTETIAPETSIVTPSPKPEEDVSSEKTRVLNSAAQEISITSEKENKRKALAKRLESLRVPPNIESPAIASLREWLPARGIYSPGSYVTPKFGSYSSHKNIENANESSQDSIFSPELVSAFEQCLQNLEAEEENILKQIIEDGEEDSDEGSSTEKVIHQHR